MVNINTNTDTCAFVVGKYSHESHDDVSVNDGPHIPMVVPEHHNTVYYNTTVLQLPTVFSTVTCCTVCSLEAIGCTI
jgi:hypothetical protein